MRAADICLPSLLRGKGEKMASTDMQFELLLDPEIVT